MKSETQPIRYNKTRFCQRLRLVRETQNLTQDDVAKRAGIAAAVVSCYECGSRGPGVESLHALCTALNCRPDYLLGFTETDWRIEP
jgi:transcriptional regulator with XRE-family HTH domain